MMIIDTLSTCTPGHSPSVGRFIPTSPLLTVTGTYILALAVVANYGREARASYPSVVDTSSTLVEVTVHSNGTA